MHYSTQHQDNRRKVSELIGRELKTTEEIHTHTDGTLIACESRTYHFLLHQRTDALKACGHADWGFCIYCKSWNDLTSLRTDRRGRSYHSSCAARYQRQRYHSKKNQLFNS